MAPGSKSKRLRRCDKDSDDESGGDELLNKHNIRVLDNRVFFNADVSHDAVFALNLRLRQLERDTLAQGAAVAQLLCPGGEDPSALAAALPARPIILHVTSYGGSVDAAFSAVDCIQGLRVPVHTVVDGYVASAATLITLAGVKRSIAPNAYMLLHELRSSLWGKMSAIDDEHSNLTKYMEHLKKFYVEHTKLTHKRLEKLLKKDVNWNAAECLEHGLVDSIEGARARDAADSDD